MLTKKQILNVLRQVHDPEIPVNLVDLGLIYDINISGSTVNITMTLTAHGCPMHQQIAMNVREAVEAMDGVDTVQVKVSWEPRWTPDRITAEGRLALGME